MIRLSFSPVEELVLQLLGEQWYTKAELQRKLFPGQSPYSVNSAIDYLRHHHLVQLLERPHGEPYYESTQLGQQVLADFRRSRRPIHLEGARAGLGR